MDRMGVSSIAAAGIATAIAGGVNSVDTSKLEPVEVARARRMLERRAQNAAQLKARPAIPYVEPAKGKRAKRRARGRK